MRHSSTLFTRFWVVVVALSACVYAQAATPPNSNAELVWPDSPLGFLAEWLSTTQQKQKIPSGWPKTVGAICADFQGADFQGAQPKILEADGYEAVITTLCREKEHRFPVSATVNFGVYPAPSNYSVDEIFEYFTTGWGSIRINPELGNEWTNLPPFVKGEIHYRTSPRSFLHFRIGLHRDLVAWHNDPIGLNLPLSAKEVDLNEPSLGYFHAENDHFAFTLGRFKVHWSPSPDFGLALSQSVPYHNAAEFAIKMPRARYRFLVSSLNPWLEGTPIGGTASEDYPIGSEEYRQRHYGSDHGASIFHNRVYADRIKTLFAHRIEGDLGRLALGITESQIIGGKVPDFRDAGPFVFFHNDFKDGYTNSALSLDAALRLPWGISLASEIYLDDAQYADTEGEGKTASLLGYLVAVRHGFAAQGWAFFQSLHLIRTDPFLYGYLQPLNTMASRHILASNFQEEGANPFVDRYVVEYPMGYLRGGDALDLWYKMEAWHGTQLGIFFTTALLSKGEVDLYTPYQEYYRSSHSSPTGTPERELRLRIGGEYRLPRGLSLQGAAAWQSIWNPEHLRGNVAKHYQVSAGIAWAFP